MQNLSTVIKLIKKLTVKQVTFGVITDHAHIINHTLEQQGIQKVIDILEKIESGDENLREIMNNLK